MVIESKLPDIQIPHKSYHDFLFDEWKQFENDVAIIDSDSKREYTYRDLMDKAEYIAQALLYLNVEKSEVVLLAMDWSPEAVYISLGVSMAGAAFLIISPKLQAWEMQFPVGESETRFVFSDALGLREVDKLMSNLNREYRIVCTGPRELAMGHTIISDLEHAASHNLPFPGIDPELDIVYLPYSSGIHGKRKGVLTSHKIMVAKAMLMWNKNHHHEFRKGDTTITMIPIQKQISLDAVLCALLNRCTVVTVRTFCVHTFMTCIQRYRIRSIYLTPYMMNLMIYEAQNYNFKLDSLEWILVGADVVTPTLYEEFIETFPSVENITTIYGMVEIGLISRNYDNKFTNSCGSLSANLQLKIVDILTGKELGIHQRDQICIKGVTANSPYLNDPKSTFESFFEGWRKTGDIGYIGEDGDIHLVDKTREMIKVFGYQVIPKEIETLLQTHKSIEEAAVVAINNDVSGQRPVAFVVLKIGQNATEDDIRNYVNKRVIRHNYIIGVNFVKILPRSPCGTLLRRLLAEAAVLSAASIGEIQKDILAVNVRKIPSITG